jgi:hypothetical protein
MFYVGATLKNAEKPKARGGRKLLNMRKGIN